MRAVVIPWSADCTAASRVAGGSPARADRPSRPEGAVQAGRRWLWKRAQAGEPRATRSRVSKLVPGRYARASSSTVRFSACCGPACQDDAVVTGGSAVPQAWSPSYASKPWSATAARNSFVCTTGVPGKGGLGAGAGPLRAEYLADARSTAARICRCRCSSTAFAYGSGASRLSWMPMSVAPSGPPSKPYVPNVQPSSRAAFRSAARMRSKPPSWAAVSLGTCTWNVPP
ncbi:Hypothetical protein SCLAV_p0484 (plasmid) [Streptomyces clavuligerus]|uniref:Uncharacterized protein n=1 Tax=Streptomyces clavuligerus TaxID=1901 RepID=D5SJ81_STRCL|nr:Hypothetical protein SCLAV_p0484 [Streptomyces clavuligerus]